MFWQPFLAIPTPCAGERRDLQVRRIQHNKHLDLYDRGYTGATQTDAPSWGLSAWPMNSTIRWSTGSQQVLCQAPVRQHHGGTMPERSMGSVPQSGGTKT